MTKSSWFEEDNNIEDSIINDGRNLFTFKKLKKETNDAQIKGTRNLFRLKKENKALKGRIIRDIRDFLSMKKKVIINQ